MPGEHEQTFATRLREVTQKDHSEAETSEFITTLMAGTRTSQDYVLLLSQYTYIYAALESEVRALSAVPELSPIFDLRLERASHLHHDLDLLLPAHGFTDVPAPVEATVDYVRHIRDAAQKPARLVAHHYLRYLGDLSGGQIIGSLVGRHYGVAQEALTMWRFEGIDKRKTYKDEYRARLNDYAVTPELAEALLEEAAKGFTLNKALFRDLLTQSQLSTLLSA
ncbi:biliverdin-producing heme oxygenase [Paeniglutamicibacter gangotriensis]|uniref:Biliverdin-producing heme oxygenase n=1 Tax=Paeniglutamicibacter gangotriensis TaxID=254787 RepID=A0A5B0ELB4_9MICC|nr:biliverdin-producing heme oxygenase [Paeniglutamicibacter gangotriensis]KAA0978945.1 biliverdin-producing heme oxygenase [Paeniglutamicibacter gangotriensis]